MRQAGLVPVLVLGFTCALYGQDDVRVIVGFNGKVDASVFANNGGKAGRSIPSANALAGTLPAGRIAKVKRNPNVAYVEEDAVVRTAAQTLDWGVDRIDADLVWSNANVTGTGVKVAVVDTGVDLQHPDLAANIGAGIDIVNGDGTAQDDNGHGTHVAGIIAAVDNSEGVIGVANTAVIMPVKVLDRNGSGYTSDVYAGVDWAVANGAQVINLSLGGPSPTTTGETSINNAVAAGVVVCAAAGNDGDGDPNNEDPPSYPGAYDAAIAVASTDPDDSVSSFSTSGPWVDLAAPGRDIYSTYWHRRKGGTSTYATLSGTSMATPHVAGAAALVIAGGDASLDLDGDGKLSVAEVRAALEDHAEDHGPCGRDNGYGNGLLDAERAVSGAARLDFCGSGGGGGGSSMVVTAIECWTESKGNPKKPRTDLFIKITVKDDTGAAVGGASVSVELTQPDGDVLSGTATTGTDGTVTFKNSNAESGDNVVKVTDVSKAGMTWDSAGSVTTHTCTVP